MCEIQFYETVTREQEYMSSLKSVSEYAAEVGKPVRTIRNQCANGKLLAMRVGNQWAVIGERLKNEYLHSTQKV